MKNLMKFLGIIALVALIGFAFIACSNGSTGGGGSRGKTSSTSGNTDDNTGGKTGGTTGDNTGDNTGGKTDGTTPIEIPLHSKWPFYVGSAAPGGAFSTSNGQYSLLGHFNVLVAENDMKPESIMPSQWQNGQSSPAYNASQAYRWTEADKLVNYAQANNTKIRGHVLFWHEQIPEAFFRTGNLTSAYVSKEVLYTRMEQHTKTVFQKYGGKVLWWDVANECVNDEGNPRVIGGANVGNSDGKSGFTAVMTAAGVTGDDRYEWIANAFKYARKYADENSGQNVKLFLTEYGIEWPGAKQDGFLRLVDYLIANNAPIDGVGIQGHTRIQDADNGYVSNLGNIIDQIATRKNPVSKKNLTVHICELDISLFTWDDTTLTLSVGETNTRLQKQATMYRNLFDMFTEKHSAGKLEMVLVWGLADGHSWLNDFPRKGRTDHPLLFNRQYQPKPAFNTLITGPSNSPVAGETVLGSFSAYAPNSHTSLSSSVTYQIVNLPGESRTDVMKVVNPTAVNPDDWAVALYSLSVYKDTEVTVTFSAEVKRVGAAGTLNWQINNSDYPSVNSISNAAAGTWHTMGGTWTGTLGNDPFIYLSTNENNSGSTTYYVDNFTITVK